MIKRRLSIPNEENGNRLYFILQMARIFEVGELFWDDVRIEYFLADVIRQNVTLRDRGNQRKVLGSGSHDDG